MNSAPPREASDRLNKLGLTVLERGWLSSNNVLCDVPGEPSVLVDTGYSSHAPMTLTLVQHALGARALDRIVNTHLHSDHCGGNALLQRTYPSVHTTIARSMLDVVARWDAEVLTYERTGQRCDRFGADAGIAPGDVLRLGRHDWQVHATAGHDGDALMFFEPTQRVLIAGDALWEKRLAIVFEALEGDPATGFARNLETLDAIEALAPALVVPGHGRPFDDVAGALASSRKRLAQYQHAPVDHTLHARRALTMFHMLEQGARDEGELIEWLQRAPVMRSADDDGMSLENARDCVNGLVAMGVLARRERLVEVVASKS
jgi:glyoxylase-like metal-dependent hydrolase (beta-lactamase superfamily II)